MQKTQLVVMVVVLVLAFAGLAFMMSQISGSSGGSSGTQTRSSAAQNAEQTFLSSCQSHIANSVDCNCLVSQLESRGYDTEDEWRSVANDARAALTSSESSKLRTDYTESYGACQR
jgi:hypothetical protein